MAECPVCHIHLPIEGIERHMEDMHNDRFRPEDAVQNSLLGWFRKTHLMVQPAFNKAQETIAEAFTKPFDLNSNDDCSAIIISQQYWESDAQQTICHIYGCQLELGINRIHCYR